MEKINKAIFILSFDCEAKWGMADTISDEINRAITNKRLIGVYSDILDLLDSYKIKSTFAFVAAMTISKSDYFNRYLTLFEKINSYNTGWLDNFNEQVLNKDIDGWFIPELLDMVKIKKMHEVASHGFTHLPLSEKQIEREAFASEMNSMKKIMSDKEVIPTTLVFPRNLIGFISEMSAFNLKGYRGSLTKDRNKYFFKIKNILNEFNIFQKAQKLTHDKEIIEIPSGFFLNWRSGVRRFVPIFVTKKRWELIIQNSIKNGGVVHMWTHPHNFISGHEQFLLFEEVLKIVSQEVSNNRLIVMTQHEYCDYIKDAS